MASECLRKTSKEVMYRTPKESIYCQLSGVALLHTLFRLVTTQFYHQYYWHTTVRGPFWVKQAPECYNVTLLLLSVKDHASSGVYSIQSCLATSQSLSFYSQPRSKGSWADCICVETVPSMDRTVNAFVQ